MDGTQERQRGEIGVGSTVVLPDGKTVATIDKVEGVMAYCIWFVGLELHSDVVEVVTLRHATDEDIADANRAFVAARLPHEANGNGGATLEGTVGAATLGDERATGSLTGSAEGSIAPASSLALLLGFLDWLSTGSERVGPFDRNHPLDRAQASRLAAAYLLELA